MVSSFAGFASFGRKEKVCQFVKRRVSKLTDMAGNSIAENV